MERIGCKLVSKGILDLIRKCYWRVNVRYLRGYLLPLEVRFKIHNFC